MPYCTVVVEQSFTCQETHGVFDEKVIQNIFEREIKFNDTSRLQLLNFSGYLENYLWPNFSESSTFEHTVSIIILLNEKFKDNLSNIFDFMTTGDSNSEKFQLFFRNIVDLSDHKFINPINLIQSNHNNFAFQGVSYVKFLINVYQSLENSTVRKNSLRYIFLPMWEHLSETRLDSELDRYPQLRKHWNSIAASKANEITSGATIDHQPSKGKRKRQAKEQSDATSKKPKPTDSKIGKENDFIPLLIENYFIIVDEAESLEDSMRKSISYRYIEAFLELIHDLLSQLPTRRFLNTLLDDYNFVTRTRFSLHSSESSLILAMLRLIDNYMNFPFHDHAGKALTYQDTLVEHHKRITKLQQLCFKSYPDKLKDLVFSSVRSLGDEETLRKHFLLLSTQEVLDILLKLDRISTKEISRLKVKYSSSNMSEDDNFDSDELYEYAVRVALDYLIPRPNQLTEINSLSMYPTEEILWDGHVMPPASLLSDQTLALPKLNLQFLTIYDYLLRSFNLYRLESAFGIREDLVDAIKRMGPREGLRNTVVFEGWARMALPIVSFVIDEVAQPRLTSLTPAFVHSSLTVSCTAMKIWCLSELIGRCIEIHRRDSI